jgi:hypothetical protein
MYIRIFALFLCFLIAFAAFPGCSTEKKGGAATAETAIPSWPPDTLKVTLVGAGHVLLTAVWGAPSPGGLPVIRSGMWSVTVGPDTTPSHTPPPPPPGLTAAMQVKAIIDLVPLMKPNDALFLVKAPAETRIVK